MSIIQLVKTALLGPVRLLLGPEKYETLRYYGYRFLARDQGCTKKYYESIEAPNSKVYDLLAQALVAVFHPSSVVDVGCGSGGISIALRDRGVRDIFPFDFFQASVAMAKSRGLLFARRLDLPVHNKFPQQPTFVSASRLKNIFQRNLSNMWFGCLPKSHLCQFFSWTTRTRRACARESCHSRSLGLIIYQCGDAS